MSDTNSSPDRDGDASSPDYRVGIATRTITPDADDPLLLRGFGGRAEEPFEEIETDLYVRVAVFEDGTGRRVLFCSVDLSGTFPEQRDLLDAECTDRWGVEPEALVFNPTHTHYAPRFGIRQEDLDDDADEADRLVAEYRAMVDETLLDTCDDAVADLEPATLHYSHAKCGMAMSRRRPAEDQVHFDANPEGPVDHDVPVLTVETGDDEPKAVLFTYACHPTTGGGSYNGVSGDWPAFAIQSIERDHPGTTAIFLIGCAGDQKAYPQGTREWVRRHGRTAANAVERAMITDSVGGRSEPNVVRGPLKVAADEAVLDTHEQRTDEEGNPAGVGVRQRSYPVQAINFGGDLTMLSLSGEVVAELSNRLKDRLQSPLWTVAYANKYDPIGYVVTDRILTEGGSEARSSGESGVRYAPGTADRVVRAATAVAERVGCRRR